MNAPIRHLVLVLGDQLAEDASALADFDPTQDVVWMAEAMQESTHVPSSKQRIAVFLSAMRHFAQTLRDKHWPVDYSKLMSNNSYVSSEFAERGYYVDRAFSCCDCSAEGVWTAEQQRWWYETLRGSQYAFAKRCRACRQRERQRKELARQVSQAGLMKKRARLASMAINKCKTN